MFKVHEIAKKTNAPHIQAKEIHGGRNTKAKMRRWRDFQDHC
jgi:hypothetical protein